MSPHFSVSAISAGRILRLALFCDVAIGIFARQLVRASGGYRLWRPEQEWSLKLRQFPFESDDAAQPLILAADGSFGCSANVLRTIPQAHLGVECLICRFGATDAGSCGRAVKR